MGTIYLTSSPTPQCRLGCLLICGKCREMRRSEAEGRFGEAEPEGCASIRAFRRVACCASALSSYLSTIMRLPSGTSPSQLHRHLRAVSLVSRHFPPLHVALCRFNSSAAPISRFLFDVRCVILAPMHAIWYRAEYRPSPSGAPWRSLPHPAKSESLNLLSLFVSLCRAGSRESPVYSENRRKR